jgi:hypothetical protein
MDVQIQPIESVRPYHNNPRVNDGAVQYKNDYLVFRDGRVFSKRSGRFLKPRIHTHGYLRLQIQQKDEYIHRIVATCFIEKPPDHNEVNHLDGNKKNNQVDNLEWCTRSRNNKHAFETGLRDYSELKMMATCERANAAKRKRRKYSANDVIHIRTMIQSGMTDSEIRNAVGGSRGAIFQIRTGKTYKETGYGSSNNTN